MIRPLYMRYDLKEAMAELGYNQAQQSLTSEFAEHGFVTLDLRDSNFDELAAQIVQGTDPLYRGEGRLQDAAISSVRVLAADRRVTDTLRILYGREPFPFQTLNFRKGTEQLTHSDTIHFDSSPPGFMAGVWVALEDIDEANGPLHYFPGSHRLPQVTLSDFGVRGSDQDGYELYVSHYEPGIQAMVRQLGLESRQARIEKGQAFIWSANLLHGGCPILDQARTRHSQVTHYYFADCAYFTPLHSDPLLGRVAMRRPFDLRTGKRRPSVYAGRPVPVYGGRFKARIRNLMTKLSGQAATE